MSQNGLTAVDARAPVFEIERVVGELAAVRQRWREAQHRSTEAGGRELPSRDALARVIADSGVVAHLCKK